MKQQLADLKAELADRQSKAQAAQASKVELTQRISQLAAAQALDNVDHSKRIATAKAELAQTEQVLATWPDVETELKRRIVIAEQVVTNERVAQDAERYNVLNQQELQQRREFAQRVIDLATIAQALQNTIDQVQTVHTDLHKAGVRVPSRPSNWLPPFNPGWVHSGQPDQAAAALKDLLF